MRAGWMIRVLIVEYLAIAVVSAFERKWPWTLYYVAAALISVAVIWMGATDASSS